MKAELKNYRQSPRKVRLVADFLRGKPVDRALEELDFVNKRAAPALRKLIVSARANAKENNNLNQEQLFIKEIRIDKGFTLKRIRPRARGSAFPINKRTSIISISLGQITDKTEDPEKHLKKTKPAEVVSKKKTVKSPKTRDPKKKIVKKPSGKVSKNKKA